MHWTPQQKEALLGFVSALDTTAERGVAGFGGFVLRYFTQGQLIMFLFSALDTTAERGVAGLGGFVLRYFTQGQLIMFFVSTLDTTAEKGVAGFGGFLLRYFTQVVYRNDHLLIHLSARLRGALFRFGSL